MGLYRRKDSKYWQLWIDGTTIRENTKIPIEAPTEAERKANRKLAEQIYNARMGDVARARYQLPGNRPTITFQKFAEWYDEHHLARHAGKEREREILPRLVRSFGPLQITAITRSKVQEWITHRLTTPQILRPIRKGGKARPAPPPSPRTVNRELDLLKAILQAAVPTYLDASPIFGMKRLKVSRPKRRLMTEDEERKILAQLAPDDRAILLLGLDSLLRQGDILDLRWSDVQEDRAWVAHPKDPKQPDPFWVPLSKRVRALLEQLPKTGEYIFSRRRGAKTERDRRNAYAHALRRACEAADVDYGRTAGGITFHWATRRTGATRMLNRQVGLGTVQKVGHWSSPDVVLAIYHELEDENARAAVESVKPRRRRESGESETGGERGHSRGRRGASATRRAS